MSIIITESPAKAKKIQGFLSDKENIYVKSSCGHIRDLYKKKNERIWYTYPFWY